jgi:hypothetical protein
MVLKMEIFSADISSKAGQNTGKVSGIADLYIEIQVSHSYIMILCITERVVCYSKDKWIYCD